MSSETENRVLVVNDHPDQLEMTSLLLGQSGYSVITACDGREGFETAQRESPDVVISNISMPRMGGIEMCRLIREHPDLRATPVLLVSASHKDSESVIEGLEAGADDYLEAPYDPMRLLTKVIQLIERKRAEEALRKSQVRLAGIVNSAMDAIITVDSEHRILLFNTAAEKMFRCSAGEAIGHALDRFIPERFRPAHSAHIRSFGQTGTTTRAMAGARAIYGLRADGEEFPLEASISQVESSEQKLYTVIMRDITERKHAEASLRASEAQLQAIVERLNDGLAVSDVEGQLLHFNRAALDMHGFASLDEGRRHLTEFADTFELAAMDGTVWPVEQWPLARILRGEKLRDLEVRIRRINTDWKRVFSYGGTLVHDAGGQPLMAVVTIRDITERNQAQAALSRLSAIVESSSDAIIGTSLDGTIVIWNPGAEKLYGYSAEEAIGRHMTIVVPADHADEEQRLLERIGRGESADNFESVRLNRDGKQIDVSINISPIRDAEGKIIGASTSARDIAEQKQAEEQLKALTADLERSNRELQDFASVASHDLQEPLRKIQTFADDLAENSISTLSDEGRDTLKRIQNAAGRMQRLINDLLSLSRISKRARPFVRVDLNNIAREVLSDLEVRINETGGRVDLREIPTIEAEPLQMRQLFQNLVGNALKFHSPGRAPIVSVHGELIGGGERLAGRSSEAQAQQLCQITFEDNSIGFDEKYVDRIFAMFQRLHGRNEYEGTGMGLAICRRIAEHHGGNITARSVPGTGSTFIVTIPTKQNTEET